MSDRFITSAVLLAAGLGTRMQPLTTDTPKPLINVAGTTLIDRVIDALEAEGVTEFAINAHYLPEQIEAHISALVAKKPDIQFALSKEPKGLLDTGGGAKKAMRLISGDPVLVANTDAFWPTGIDKPLERLAAQYRASPGLTLLCALPMRATGFHRSHDFCLAPDKTITLDRGAPVIYTGIMLVPRQMLAQHPGEIFSTNDLMTVELEKRALRGVLLNAPWHHVGDPEGLQQAEAALA